MQQKINDQREYFNQITPVDVSTRLENLKALRGNVKKYEKEIYLALFEDLGKQETEAFVTEVGLVFEEFEQAIKKLKSWTKPVKVRTPLSQFPGKSMIVYEPYGQILIMTPWNYPFMLTLIPLIGALAAGNVVVIKPSAYSPRTAEIIKKIIEESFREEVLVFLGGRDVNEEILTFTYDYIFFTGSTEVGKLVMKKASDSLTPVTLELGGKSPVIISETADIDLTVRRLKWAKLINLGQTCVAPDYALVVGDNKEFISKLTEAFKLTSDEKKILGKIVNTKHYERLKGYLTELGLSSFDENTKNITPTLINNPPLDSKIMNEEIFGPLLPLIYVTSVEEAIKFINARPKPLALYLYTDNREEIEKVLYNTSSGSLTVNDSLIQLANPNLPFGGVGASGMGSYHGKTSFTTFSHQKSVLIKKHKLDFAFRYQLDEKSGKKFRRIIKNK